jgi:hypothetical protein
MLRAVACALSGLALIGLSGLEFHLLSNLTGNRIPILFALFVLGLLLLAFGALRLWYWPYRHSRSTSSSGGNDLYDPSITGYLGHVGDCGQTYSGGCGDDSGGSH